MRKQLSSIFTVLLIMIFTSCQKSEFVSNKDYQSGLYAMLSKGGVVEHNLTKFNDFQDVPLGIGISVPGELKKDVTVNIAIDTAALNKYNTERYKNFITLPGSNYKIPSSVTIAAGSNSSSVKVPLSVSMKGLFDNENEYALPITITDAGGIPIDPKFTTVFLTFPKPNNLAGDYKMLSGTRKAFNINQTVPFLTVDLVPDRDDKPFTKIGVNTYLANKMGNLTASPTTNLTIKLKDDLTFDITGYYNTQFIANNTVGVPSTYNPVTKTITLNYTYYIPPTVAAEGTRVFNEVLIKK